MSRRLRSLGSYTIAYDLARSSEPVLIQDVLDRQARDHTAGT